MACVWFVCTGLFVALISEGHVYVVEPGDTVSLECNFHADQYDLFEYPVLWRKRQHLEDSQVNVMGTLMEPFSQRNRFEVTFDAFDSRYRLMLHIHGRLSPSLISHWIIAHSIMRPPTKRSHYALHLSLCTSVQLSVCLTTCLVGCQFHYHIISRFKTWQLTTSANQLRTYKIDAKYNIIKHTQYRCPVLL